MVYKSSCNFAAMKITKVDISAMDTFYHICTNSVIGYDCQLMLNNSRILVDSDKERNEEYGRIHKGSR